MLKVGTLFSGIGTPEQSLKHLQVEHETVFACEIDKYARTTYLANNEAPNTFYEDVTKLDANKYLDKIDILIGGFPCQAFSIAGKQLGFEDTRGTLFFDTARIIKESKPKVFILENVKGLISHDIPKYFAFETIKFKWEKTGISLVLSPINKEATVLKKGVVIDGVVYAKGYPSVFNKEYEGKTKGIGRTLHTIENVMKEFNYKIYWDVLNTKDYLVPQNRERIYIVGFKDNVDFHFQEKQELKLRLKDMLEDEVDEKYLLSEKLATYFNEHKKKHDEKGNGFGWKPTEGDSVASTITARVWEMGATDNYIKLEQTHTLNIKGNDSIKRIYSSDGHNPSLTTMQGGHREPKIAHPVREVGRRLDENGKRCDDNKDIPITRRYEIGDKEISNYLSGVQKDSYVAIAKIPENIIEKIKPCDADDSCSIYIKEQNCNFSIKNIYSISNTEYRVEYSNGSIDMLNNEIDGEDYIWQYTKEYIEFAKEEIKRKPKSEMPKEFGELFDKMNKEKVLIANGVIEIENDKVRVREAVAKGFTLATEGDSINISVPSSKTRRGRVGKQVAQTLDTACNQVVFNNKYIFRKLTPRECFRLQGFDDSFIFPPKMSDTQLYKQAGNGMSRNILDMIFTQIFTCYAKHIENKQN